MTNWLPAIPAGAAPIYVRLADQIADDIASGALPPGYKLPPQRNLAFDLGVTVGTIGRAYALIRKRGLVNGEVGRGTYVLGSVGNILNAANTIRHNDRGGINGRSETGFSGRGLGQTNLGSTRVAVPAPEATRLDGTAAPDIGQAAMIGSLLADIVADSPRETSSYTRIIPETWRLAGQKWLARPGWCPDLKTIVPSFGGQAAIMAAIAATTSPGDRIVFEELTYSSIARGAVLCGRQPVPVARDKEGVIPGELEKICAQLHPKLIFLMPTMHNPTLRTMNDKRRKDIVEIARNHNLWIIEDEVYASLREIDFTPIAAIAPERTFHVGSLSKAVSAGIRGGWVSGPLSHIQRLLTAHKMQTGGISFLVGELAARLVLNGHAQDLRRQVMAEIKARHDCVQRHLQGYEFTSAPDAPFLWLKLPEPWLPGTFKAAAADLKVLIDDEDEFKAGRTDKIFHRVRLGFTHPQNLQELEAALAALRNLLDSGTAAYDSFE